MRRGREYLERIDIVNSNKACPPPSFPRRRESRPWFFRNLKIAAIPNPWVPACAGMTVWGVLI